MNSIQRTRVRVLGVPIDVLSWGDAIGRVEAWAAERSSRYICICNAHSVVTGALEDDFRAVVDGADMATADGTPVAWMLRKLGHPGQQRINGPDLMWKYLGRAEQIGQKVYFYGGKDSTLDQLRDVLQKSFPKLLIVGVYSPPFRALTEAEQQADVERINSSGAQVVFVGLGCPKQERWMSVHRGRVAAVMIGVGAAFDYHAGTIQRAPLWMQNAGLEWLHRLASEPRRLWKRYFYTNSMFVLLAGRQLIGRWLAR